LLILEALSSAEQGRGFPRRDDGGGMTAIPGDV